MRFDGMIFDIEGTLIDCIPDNLRSWQETLSTFGLTVPSRFCSFIPVRDGDDMLQILAPDMDKKVRKSALEAKREGGKIAIATDCTDPVLGQVPNLTIA